MNSNNISELVLLPAIELAERIRLRQVSCREVMQTYLAHIERFNPSVNALISLQAPEDLLAQADTRDAELSRGQYRGWMHGLPHAIKDLSLTCGIRTTLGSPLFKNFIPERDGIMVERIKAAGAIIIGKTNTPEFGLGSQSYNPLFGATGCAFDPSKTAGGSQWRRGGGAGDASGAGGRWQRHDGLAAQPGSVQQYLRLPPVSGASAIRRQCRSVLRSTRL